jgi:hypothetical protein
MTDLATRVEEALAADAARVAVDVEQMWADHEQRLSPQRAGWSWRWLAPVCAAAAVLSVLVPVDLALNHHAPRAARPVAGTLPPLPPWPDGSTVPPAMLPAPASPVVEFHTTNVIGPRHVVTTHYLYYATAPDRLCGIEATTDLNGTNRLVSIQCAAAASYAPQGLVINTGVALLGAAPRGAHAIKVGTPQDGTTTKVIDEDGLPQPLFFVDLSAPGRGGGTTWSFVSKSGRVLRSSPPAPPRLSPPSDGSGKFHPRPATSDIARFVLPVFPYDAAKSRLLEVYYAGRTNEYCSREYRILAGGQRKRLGEDCGGAVNFDTAPATATIPWSTDGVMQKLEFWGLMPAAAVRAETTINRHPVPLQVARPNGMPAAVYAASVTITTPYKTQKPGAHLMYDVNRLPSTLYCLDGQGQIVAATSWNMRY